MIPGCHPSPHPWLGAPAQPDGSEQLKALQADITTHESLLHAPGCLRPWAHLFELDLGMLKVTPHLNQGPVGEVLLATAVICVC